MGSLGMGNLGASCELNVTHAKDCSCILEVYRITFVSKEFQSKLFVYKVSQDYQSTPMTLMKVKTETLRSRIITFSLE